MPCNRCRAAYYKFSLLLNKRKGISDIMRQFFTVPPALRTTVRARRPVAFKSFQSHTFIAQYFLVRTDKSHEYYRLAQPTPGSRFDPRITLRIQRGVLNTTARHTVLWHTSIWRVSKTVLFYWADCGLAIDRAVRWLACSLQIIPVAYIYSSIFSCKDW
jgi:hypothetical protein